MFENHFRKRRERKAKSMFYSKNMKRLFRRCAAMTKIATMMMIFIFFYGFLEANFETDSRQRNDLSETSLLSRRQRMHESIEYKTIVYDATEGQDTTLEQKQQKENNLIARIAGDTKKTTSSNANNNAAKAVVQQIRPKVSVNEPMFINTNYDVMKTEEFISEEKKNEVKWRKKIEMKEFPEVPSNPYFIFHNKLPKSGSSTMNNILKKLSRDNHFNFLKMETTDVQTSDDNYLINQLKGKVKEPFLLLKHHRWLNFTKSQQAQPTYINVMRDPLEWFTSRYYFSRYGWERKPGCRQADCGMTDEERLMEIDECVKNRHRECMSPWMYLQFFCGTSPECYVNNTSIKQKQRATEIAKANILHEYHMVGILEQFEDSLRMFEVILPSYFKSAVTVWKSEFVQIKQNMTRTTYKKEMSEESKEFFRNGPLHFEIQLYNFARELFNERMKRLHMKSTLPV